MEENNIPKEIKVGNTYTTSWAGDSSRSWKLINVTRSTAHLMGFNGHTFTTDINTLREVKKVYKPVISDHFLDTLKYAMNALNKLETPKPSNAMKVETTSEKVLEASVKNPESKKVLEALFPEVFEDTEIFCEIGSIFFREKFPNNIYAVVKKGDEIIVMNITWSTKWNNDSGKRTLKVSELANDKIISRGEFKKLTGYTDLSGFAAIPKGFNRHLLNFSAQVASTVGNR